MVIYIVDFTLNAEYFHHKDIWIILHQIDISNNINSVKSEARKTNKMLWFSL